MKNKLLPYVLVITAIILIFTLEEFKTDKEDLPGKTIFAPLPPLELTIDGLPVEHIYGQYDWVKNGTGPVIDSDEPPILFNKMQIQSIKPFSELKMNFSQEPRQVDIASIQWGQGLEEGIIAFTSLFEQNFTFNNIPGKQTIIIRAYYGEQEVHYTFPIIIEKVISFQHQLAEEKGSLAILEIYDEKQQGANWALDNIKNRYIHKAQSLSVGSIEEARLKFPDLEIKSLPNYAIFDHEKLLYQVYDEKEFFKLIPVVLP